MFKAVIAWSRLNGVGHVVTSPCHLGGGGAPARGNPSVWKIIAAWVIEHHRASCGARVIAPLASSSAGSVSGTVARPNMPAWPAFFTKPPQRSLRP